VLSKRLMTMYTVFVGFGVVTYFIFIGMGNLNQSFTNRILTYIMGLWFVPGTLISYYLVYFFHTSSNDFALMLSFNHEINMKKAKNLQFTLSVWQILAIF
jgi:hypothetical protein